MIGLYRFSYEGEECIIHSNLIFSFDPKDQESVKFAVNHILDVWEYANENIPLVEVSVLIIDSVGTSHEFETVWER